MQYLPMIMAQNHPNYTNMSASASNFGSYNSWSTAGGYGQYTNFDVSEIFEFHHDDWIQHDNNNNNIPAFTSIYPAGNYNDSPHHHDLDYYTPNEAVVDDSTPIISSTSSSPELTINNREKKETREKVAFRTKSEIEILDDGFKWRKYGKKMVKNSPNPRNYYKCSVEGCLVKKRVERDKEDHRYVLTTYEGIHNHHQGSTRL